MIEKAFEVTNKSGLHARPASLFVNETKNHKANIKLTFEDRQVDAKSILGIMSLGIPKGSKVSIQIDGEDEEVALSRIELLFEENFGEEE
jgi:phosphocarrier protein HPr